MEWVFEAIGWNLPGIRPDSHAVPVPEVLPGGQAFFTAGVCRNRGGRSTIRRKAFVNILLRIDYRDVGKKSNFEL